MCDFYYEFTEYEYIIVIFGLVKINEMDIFEFSFGHVKELKL